ncbi:hypothetical protein AGMMS50256_07590 [Betaproteobacteria bacterium]|nr:hypothetical protein AGMMS50256_07590 [Betaproteobacteria bacterium]
MPSSTRTPAQEFAYLNRLQPAEALAYLQGRGKLTPTFSWQDLWQEEHAEQFTVSRLARLDILKAMQEGIERSVSGDLTRRDWTRDMKSLLKKEGWWGTKEVTDPATGETLQTTFDSARLKLIYDTNTRMAYSAGHWQQAVAARASHPYIRYITKHDERVRLAHRHWDGLTLPIDDPFWKTHFPPNGWRCRCRTTSVSQAEYERLKSEGRIKTGAPREVMRDFVNRKTGEVTRVPVGIDPGFAYNPGIAAERQARLTTLTREKLDALPAPIRNAAMKPIVSAGVSPEFSQAVTDAYAALPQYARLSLAYAGYEVKVVDKIVNAAPELAGKPVRGYGKGLTYEYNDALLRIGEKQVLIAEQALDPDTKQWMINPPDRGMRAIRHETGHALDEIHEISRNQALIDVWERERKALLAWDTSGWNERYRIVFQYFTQAYPAGLEETIADLYAQLRGGSTGWEVDLLSAYPETSTLLQNIFKGLRL